MIKKIFRCGNCNKDFQLFIKRNEKSDLNCTHCGNQTDNKEIYLPVNIHSEEKAIDDVGNETTRVIEENSLILSEMKKEIMKWN